MLQDGPLCFTAHLVSSIPGWYSIELQNLLSWLGVASPAPDFSLRMNYYDSKVGLQGSSDGPHGSSESLCCSEVTLYSPELAFRRSGLVSTLYGLGWAFTAPWWVSMAPIRSFNAPGLLSMAPVSAINVQEEPSLLHDELTSNYHGLGWGPCSPDSNEVLFSNLFTYYR